MSFLNPFLLIGLGAAALPVIIHLLNRKRHQQVRWAAMRFLKKSVERTRQKSRVEDLLLLLLRCLLILLLCLAFAKPAFLKTVPLNHPAGAGLTVFLIDNSMSMSFSDGGRSLFEKAVEAVDQQLEKLPTGSMASVLLVSDFAQDLVTEPSSEISWVRSTLKEARVNDHKTSLKPGFDRAFQILKTHGGLRKELVFVTDGQAEGWKSLDELQNMVARETDVAKSLVLVASGPFNNLGVTEVRVAEGALVAGKVVRVEAQAHNFGDQPVSNFPVNLSGEDGTVKDQAVIPRLDPGEGKFVSLFVKVPKAGLNRFSIGIPNDSLKSDNSRPFLIFARKSIEVLVVNGQPGAERRLNETFFVEHALRPINREQAADYFLQTRVITTEELGAVSLQDFAVVILANVKIVPEFSEKLMDFVSKGGGLIYFPGSNVASESQAGLESWFPAQYVKIMGDAKQEENFFRIDSKILTHPVVSLWKDANAGTLGSARFFQAYEMRVPKPDALVTTNNQPSGSNQPAREVLLFENGSPALAERTVGEGKVFQFASTADTEWNDFPVRPGFVPLLHRLILATVQKGADRHNVLAGEEYREKGGLQYANRDMAVTHEKLGKVGSGRVELAEGWPTLRFAKTDAVGFYSVSDGGAFQTSFAVQTVPEESNLRMLDARELEQIGRQWQVTRNNQKSFSQQLLTNPKGLELWPALLAAAIAVAALEMVLGFVFSRPK